MHLPQEVHDLIISDLGRGNYSNYRLIGHSFAQAAIPYLFNRLDFSPEISSLRNLARIASQEHLSQHVKHLEWTSSEKVQIGFGSKEWEAVREALQADAQEESEGHVVEDTGLRILTFILRHMPNLETLQVRIWDSREPTDRRVNASNPESMIRGEYEMYTLLAAAHAAGCPITEFALVGWWFEMHPLFRTNIWPSLVPACKDLTALTLPVNFALGTDEKARWLDSRSGNEAVTIAPAFATIYSEHSTAAQTASLQAFLASLSKLRTLKLDCKAEHWDDEASGAMTVHMTLRAPFLHDILPSSRFPYLHTLHLDHASTSTAYLKALLSKHKETLQVAKLSSVRFAICGARDEDDAYAEEGCAPLKRFLEFRLGVDEWEVSCANCGCDLLPCCRGVGGIEFCC
jgi:hypothetical protein